jgi:ComEC/Rec2-related protein
MVWLYSVALAAGVSGWTLVSATFPALLPVASFVPADARRRFLLALALCAACYAHGIVSHTRFENAYRRLYALSSANGGRRVALVGRVAGFPEHRPGAVRFPFEATVYGERATLLVSTTAFGISYGDSLELTGTLSPGRLDRRRFLHSRGACGYLRVPAGGVVEMSRSAGRAGSPGRLAWRAHDAIRRRLARRLGARAGLPTALSIGERGWLPRRVTAAFSHLGVNHLLALSGMHLGMVAAALLGALRLVRARLTWLLLPLLGAYVCVVGAVVSLYRAYALAAVLYLSARVERRSRPVHALGVGLFVLLTARPPLVHSVAFQLSFTATLGVLLAASRLRFVTGGGRVRRAMGWVGATLVVGLCVQLFVLPLQLRYFGAVTPLTPAATLLFLPPVAAVMLLTAVVLAADFLVPQLSGVTFVALDGLAATFERVVVAVASWVPAPVELPEPNIVIYYCALGVCFKIVDAMLRRRVL